MSERPAPEGKRPAAERRRRQREAELIAATRRLFDERGVRETQVEDIVSAVGINRAVLYRHFTGKEELFALTLVGYLEELRAALEESVAGCTEPRQQVAALVTAFVEYGAEHPAFVDCAQSLMLQPGEELLDAVAPPARLPLGKAISGCLSVLVAALERGVAYGEFSVADPVLVANILYATGLGALQLARVGILVAEVEPGVPTIGRITREQVRDHLVSAALAAAGAPAR
ncbi:MAG TPA: TetR/AcrR family transcriptional regulator [Nocardioides sp.]|uniref:TetR/AcrR family transcriptional regulator n=1 Tax=Nocardioides sp. TaxID=35761 RepID=UPI002B71AB9E|nr:TetR/AcrR family transcriptional regulator [Nocardioides sp.]HQR27886.1 TetR/AcrR family transcriptional regulator [Nocardioides sp.]